MNLFIFANLVPSFFVFDLVELAIKSLTPNPDEMVELASFW